MGLACTQNRSCSARLRRERNSLEAGYNIQYLSLLQIAPAKPAGNAANDFHMNCLYKSLECSGVQLTDSPHNPTELVDSLKAHWGAAPAPGLRPAERRARQYR
jgi:hypothetical protein